LAGNFCMPILIFENLLFADRHAIDSIGGCGPTGAYNVGEVVFVERRRFFLLRYHHACLVTAVDDIGNFLEGVDFVPLSSKPVMGKKQGTLRTLNREEFPKEFCVLGRPFVVGRRELSQASTAAMHQRVQTLRSRPQMYSLFTNNCQHAAFFLRDGHARSPDLEKAGCFFKIATATSIILTITRKVVSRH
jgi:hypothetical protein